MISRCADVGSRIGPVTQCFGFGTDTTKAVTAVAHSVIDRGGGLPSCRTALALRKKKEGRPLPHGKSPGAPNSTSSGAGSSRFAATTFLRGTYSPARDLFLWTKEKGTRPDGCLRQHGYQGGAPTAEMSAFLASRRNLPEDGVGRGPVADQAAICAHHCGGAALCLDLELGRTEKCCPQCGGSKVGRFAATSLDP